MTLFFLKLTVGKIWAVGQIWAATKRCVSEFVLNAPCKNPDFFKLCSCKIFVMNVRKVIHQALFVKFLFSRPQQAETVKKNKHCFKSSYPFCFMLSAFLWWKGCVNTAYSHWWTWLCTEWLTKCACIFIQIVLKRAKQTLQVNEI